MNVNPVNTAIIGCGMISEAYLKTITTKFQILQLTACCDLDQSKAEKAAADYNLKVMTLEEILNDIEIEMVINLTTAQVHYTVIKQLLQAGKHVYTEKVLAVELHEAKELSELAEKKGLYLGAAPDTFLGAAIQTANYIVNTGMIGEVTSCHAVLTRDVDLMSSFFSFSTKPGGGIAFDVGIYYITALLSILGPVQTVTGFMETRKKERIRKTAFNHGEPYLMECENLTAASIVFQNGVFGNLLFDSNSIMTMPERPVLTIHGTLGILYLSDPNMFGGEVKILLKGHQEPYVFPHTHPYADETRGIGAAEMAWSIRKGRKHRASQNMAYHALEVLHGIGISARGRMHYDLQTTFEIPTAMPRGYLSGMQISQVEEGMLAE